MGNDTYTVRHWNEAKHVHEPSIFTTEQNFAFDALGFVVLPQALSQAELSACRPNGDGLDELCSENGAVGRYVHELCGDGFRQDGLVRHVPADAAGEHDEASLPLEGGAHTLDRAYINLTGWNGHNADGPSLSRAGGAWEEVRIRQCQGLVVAIALTDSADGKCPLVVVPSSHKSGLPAPPLESSSRFAERPALAAGDVLLCAACALHGICPQSDGGELLVLAPGLREFGEDRTIDELIRKYGYPGTPETIALVAQNEDLGNCLGAAAHMMHGSSEGRFSINYCPGEAMSREEIESVGYRYADLGEMLERYPPDQLDEGFNTMPDGEEIYFISNPALGLWALQKDFSD